MVLSHRDIIETETSQLHGCQQERPEIAGSITSRDASRPIRRPLILFTGSKSTDTVEEVVVRELANRIGCTVQFAGSLVSFAIAERPQLRSAAMGRLGMPWQFAPPGLCDALVVNAEVTYWDRFHE